MDHRQSMRSDTGGEDIANGLSGFIGHVVNGYTEAFAAMADAAERFSDAVYTNDPRAGAATSGDIVRNLPRALYRTARQLNEEWLSARERFGERLDPSSSADLRGASRGTASAPSQPETPSERRIVAAARSFMARSAQRGVTLSGLMKHLRAATPYSDAELRGVLDRHFTLADNDLVYDAAPSAAPPSSTVQVQSIEEHLRALGYTDLRRDVVLEPGDPRSPAAELVAYEKGVPVILVAVVPVGQTDDPIAVEQACFRARLLSHGGGAVDHVFLTDRRTNRYVDVRTSCLIPQLPRAAPTAA